MPDFIDERVKWNEYYDSLPLPEEDDSGHLLSQELVDSIGKLLPGGGRILEAGCGGGWQSLALARTGRYQISVLDFAPKALDHTRRVFERAGITAEYLLDDASNLGEPQFDLVFNAGVLEHYTLDQQTRLLRGMASRSRGLVLAIIPNSLCYWYWLWRIHHTARGGWPFGKEVPQAGLESAFDAVGLDFLGHQFLGAAWTESFVASLTGLDSQLKEEILYVHRSPLIPVSQKSYLVAALGSVRRGVQAAGWAREVPCSAESPELAAALADALAMCISTGNRAERLDQSLSESERLRQQTGETLHDVREEAREQARRSRHVVDSISAELANLQNMHAQMTAHARRENHTQLKALRKAENVRSRAAFGLREYQTLLAGDFSKLESQRAWKIMLAVRKAYTLLLHRGLHGKLAFVKWMFTWPFTASDLQRYAPILPQVSSYLPGELSEPIHEGVLSANAGDSDSPREPHTLPCGAPAQTSYDVVILAIIDFDFRFQRPQQLAAQFARNGHRVFWISPTRFLQPSASEPYQVYKLRDNIYEIRLRSHPVDIYMGRLEETVARGLAHSLASVYKDFAIAESCVLAQLPFWRQLGLLLRQQQGSKLLYDCMDDWETFLNMGKFNVEEERLLVRECDLLIVTAQKLADKFTTQGLQPLLVRNGADFDFFQTAKPNPSMEAISHPVVGYFGAIADWIDLDLVYGAAQSRPSYSFVLIGQIFDRDVTKLQSLKNVFLLGNKDYKDIPSYLASFDICIIPFLLNQVTQATDPVKLYEYFSLGKPVVATDMAELKQCHHLLYIGDGPEDFASKIDEALAEADRTNVGRRIAFASENSWAHRVSVLDTSIRELFPLVSIIIVTYNSMEFIEPCLDSIRSHTSYPNYEVLLVDNHSRDGSSQAVEAAAAKDARVRAILLDSNRGFAGANNCGVAAAGGQYFILLNADTMVTSGWIERLLRRIRRDSSIGLVCPVTNYAGNEVKITVDYQNQDEMESFALELASEKLNQDCEVFMAPLFCGLIPRPVWDIAGPLDERFEIGMFEDDDFAQSLHKAGYRIVAAEDCFVHHFGQGSFKTMPPADYNKLFEDNRRRFEQKWNATWHPHRPRPNVKPAHEEQRFIPKAFVRYPDGPEKMLGQAGA